MRMILTFQATGNGTTRCCMRYNLVMKPVHLIMIALFALAPWHGLFSPAMADSDHLEARRLLHSGEIMSLEMILERIRHKYPGRVIEVELEMKRDQIVYEIEIIDDKGKVHELYVNARNGELIHHRDDD